jgi:hypothetical protein
MVWSNWKSMRPQGVGGDQRHGTDVGADTGQPLLAGLGRHLEALVAPQPANTLVVDPPAVTAQLGGGASPSPPGSTLREGTEELA